MSYIWRRVDANGLWWNNSFEWANDGAGIIWKYLHLHVWQMMLAVGKGFSWETTRWPTQALSVPFSQYRGLRVVVLFACWFSNTEVSVPLIKEETASPFICSLRMHTASLHWHSLRYKWVTREEIKGKRTRTSFPDERSAKAMWDGTYYCSIFGKCNLAHNILGYNNLISCECQCFY